jgi:hypothetical protein
MMVEFVVGTLVLAVAIVGLLDAFLRQNILTTHARYVSWAMNDAARVMEELRQQNLGAACAAPSAAAPAGFASWNEWLGDTGATGGGGKSIPPDPLLNELVVVTSSGANPLTVTVAVCWRAHERTLGECTWDGAQLTANDADGNGIITSPATLATLLTCRVLGT